MEEVLRLLSGALRLEGAMFGRIDDDPLLYIWPALGVALLAALSTMAGQVAILLLNRIKGWRLLTSLLLGGALMSALYVIQMVITWGVAALVLQRPLPLLPLIVTGLIALAPQVFSFVTAFPHLGMLFARVLGAWSYLVMVTGVSYTFGLEFGWALGFTLVGWLVVQLLSRLLQRPINWTFSHAWTLATGQPTMLTARDILNGSPVVPVSYREEAGR